MDLRKKHPSVASCRSPDRGPGCALARDRTGELVLCEMRPNPLSHAGRARTSQFSHCDGLTGAGNGHWAKNVKCCP